MFTGIIEEVGKVIAAGQGSLRVEAPLVTSDARPGDSIAVDGVDLTVFELSGGAFSANVMPETYRRSTLSGLQPGDSVNLERSVRPSDRLSGHIVRGVIEATGEIVSVMPDEDALLMKFRAPGELLRGIIVKGPVAVDGVSLTVIEKATGEFTVSLVQFTRDHSALSRKPVGARVNLETDIVGRYVMELASELTRGDR